MKLLAPVLTRLGLFAVLVLLAACRSADSPRAAPRLVMIGIDAGSWKLFDPMILSGELPHLAALGARGTTAELETVKPVISPAVWTSIATGQMPEVHGVTTFFADRRAIRVPTVWERLAAAGLRVGLYDHLLSWPPRPLDGGFVIPGWLRRDFQFEPADAFTRAGLEPYFYEVLDVGDDDDVLANLERELARKPPTWNGLARAFDLDAGAVVFYALDVISHRHYHTEFPQEFASPPTWEPRFDGVLRRIARQIDEAVGEIVADLGEKGHVVVISDHGISANPNAERRWGFDAQPLLTRAGIDPERDRIRPVSEFGRLILTLERAQSAQETDRREALLKNLVDLLTDVRHPAGDMLFEVEMIREPATLDVGEAPPWLADLLASESRSQAFLVVKPRDEVLAALWPEGEALLAGEPMAIEEFCTPHVFTGGHDPIGVLLAAGPAIRQTAKRNRLSVLDVAPLLTYLAGQPIPDNLRELRSELIDPRFLRRQPPRRIPAAAAPRLEEAEDDATKAEDEEIRRRLRALGYLG